MFGRMPSPARGEPAVWRPGAAELERSRVTAFLRAVGCADLDELDARARRDPAWFWGAAWDALELEWQDPPERIVDRLEDPPEAEWYPGGRFNLAANAVDRWVRRGRGDEPALLWEHEGGRTGAMTFAELATEVERVAGGLAACGVGTGDRVGIQLPLIAEAAVAQLACARIGAIAVPIFSGFGSGAVADRLGQVGARAHIVADRFPRRGRDVDLRATVADAAARLPELETVVVVDSAGDRRAGPSLPGEVAWRDLRAHAPVPAAVLPARHPLMVAFTSGTTGAPKGAVLTQAGFAVKAGSDAAWCFDLGPGDRAAWITDPGWIMAPITVLGGLLAGSAVALYGGAIDHPRPDRLWHVVQRLGVTMLGVSPTLVRTLLAAGRDALPPRPLTSLRVLASSGEPWTGDAYRWLFERVGRRRLPIVNYSGGTEVSGAILCNTTSEPIHEGAFARPVPGMAADIADEHGRPLRGGVGELVLRRPSPGMTDGFWGDRERCRATYWSRWPGTWVHGDWAEIDGGGVWHIRGRSDDTLKVAGKRLGPAEVEAAVNAHEHVIESAAIGIPDPIKGEVVIVFARPHNGGTPVDEEALRREIAAAVVAQLGRALRPHAVLFVDDLPRTRSGKILRRMIRSAYLGERTGDGSALEDPAGLAEVRRAR